ncbi:MFS transporter [Runella sp.]|uniref:MFS transporter n=1 Tax=Runella sp. TaxID=1960881 RepID=UPI003D105CF6
MFSGKKISLFQHCQPTVFALGIGHGFSDAAAGFLMGSLAHKADFTQTAGVVMLYNVLAFGGQLPAGIWLDRMGKYRAVSLISLATMILALFFSGSNVWLFTVLAGISSAFFHVAGGGTTLMSFPQRSVFVGIFSAFGVFGLALGGWAAAMQWHWITYLLITGLSSVLLFLIWAKFPLNQQVSTPQKEQPLLDTHDYVMILLLVAIAMRSAVWNFIQLIYTQQYEWLFYIALAAMIGKLAGGWLADRFGARLYTLAALAISIPALSWGYKKLFWLMLGTGLLQSVTPVSVTALQKVFPKMPATVSGAAFGLAIALGGVIPLSAEFYFLPQLILVGLCVWGLYFYAFKLHKTLYNS